MSDQLVYRLDSDWKVCHPYQDFNETANKYRMPIMTTHTCTMVEVNERNIDFEVQILFFEGAPKLVQLREGYNGEPFTSTLEEFASEEFLGSIRDHVMDRIAEEIVLVK